MSSSSQRTSALDMVSFLVLGKLLSVMLGFWMSVMMLWEELQ